MGRRATRSQRHFVAERRQRLDALGFVWDPLTAQWEEGVGFLERYRQDKGDCLVPATYCDPASGFRLGPWVSDQRKAKDTMSPERRERLDVLGFVWDPLAAQWEQGLRLPRNLSPAGRALSCASTPSRASGFQLGTVGQPINAAIKMPCRRPTSAFRRPWLCLGSTRGFVGRRIPFPGNLSPAGRALSHAGDHREHRLSVRTVGQ